MAVNLNQLPKDQRDRLLAQQSITDRKYITDPQLELIESLLARSGSWDWTDFREICQEAFCEHRDMELDADQADWKDLSSPQASAVIDWLKMNK